MFLSGFISNIHWIPVLVVSILSFIVGFVWHSPALFGKAWTAENYADKDKLKPKAPLIFGGTAVLHVIALSGLSAVVSGMGAIMGLLGGLSISVVWILPALGGTYLFAGRSLRLLAIDAGMYIVLFSLSGLILGIW